jgi:hypothetical protein
MAGLERRGLGGGKVPGSGEKEEEDYETVKRHGYCFGGVS